MTEKMTEKNQNSERNISIVNKTTAVETFAFCDSMCYTKQ